MAELRLSIYIYMSLVLEKKKKKEEQEKNFTNIRGKFISWGGSMTNFYCITTRVSARKMKTHKWNYA